MQIGTYVEKMLMSELSGNVIGGFLCLIIRVVFFSLRFVPRGSAHKQALCLHGQTLGDEEDRDRRRAGQCWEQHCGDPQDRRGEISS